MKAPFAALAVGLPLLVASGCGGGGDSEGAAGRKPAASRGAVVTVKVFSFAPDPLRVKPGTRVVWRNQDATRHNVVGKGFKGDLPEGASYGYTFETAGTYTYRCTIHSGPGMRAKVVVG